MRRRHAIGAGLLLVAALLLGSGLAGGATVRVGSLVLHADGGFEPRLLPKRTFAPIRFYGYGDIKTTDGSQPPALQHVKLYFDRDGRLTTTGLPVCAPASVEGLAPGAARQRCRGALVGVGELGATVPLPDVGRIQMNAPLTIFNGPRQDGDATVVLHAQAPAPISETYVILIPVERRPGFYRYRSEFDIPLIEGGAGSLTHIDVKIGRRWRTGGVERSYISARCSDYILQTKGYFSFADGNVIYGSVFKACRPKP
jgi:hypothetical protein